jgi:hypothetical protein
MKVFFKKNKYVYILGLLSIIIVLTMLSSGCRPQEPNPKPFRLSQDIVKEIRIEPYMRHDTFKSPRILTEDDVIFVIKAFNSSFDRLTWRDRSATPQLIMTVILTDGRKVIIREMGMEFAIDFIEGDNSSSYLVTSLELKEIFQRFVEPEFTISEHPLHEPHLKGYITAIDPKNYYNWMKVLVTSSKDILDASAGYFPDAYPAYWVGIPRAYRDNFLIGHEIEVIFKDYLESHQYPHITFSQQVYFVQKEKPDGLSLTEQKVIELALKKIKVDVPVIKYVIFDKHQQIWQVTVLHGKPLDKPGILIKIDDYSWEVEDVTNERPGSTSSLLIGNS